MSGVSHLQHLFVWIIALATLVLEYCTCNACLSEVSHLQHLFVWSIALATLVCLKYRTCNTCLSGVSHLQHLFVCIIALATLVSGVSQLQHLFVWSITLATLVCLHYCTCNTCVWSIALATLVCLEYHTCNTCLSGVLHLQHLHPSCVCSVQHVSCQLTLCHMSSDSHVLPAPVSCLHVREHGAIIECTLMTLRRRLSQKERERLLCRTW